MVFTNDYVGYLGKFQNISTSIAYKRNCQIQPNNNIKKYDEGIKFNDNLNLNGSKIIF